MRTLVALLSAAAVLVFVAPAGASPDARFGIHDDAWLVYGPGTLETRLDRLDRLGVDLVRFTLRWDEIATERPEAPRSPDDDAYKWGFGAAVIDSLHDRGIDTLLTLYGTPRWANGGRSPNAAPLRGTDFADFAAAAADRFPWVRDWLIWNEPNQRRWLVPTSPRIYVQRLLNPAYAALHRELDRARVGGGVTAPRGNVGGVSPVKWIRGMRAAGARLDAYAHHPYPLRPRFDTPFAGGCRWWRCETITMATLERLLDEVRFAWGAKRIWLTEYGYQTNPPDRTILGVPYALQARYIGEAALRVWQAPAVDMLVHFLVQDDAVLSAWQSGLYTVRGVAKPAARAFPLPLAQVWRRDGRVRMWGQVRARDGVQPFRLRIWRGGRWIRLGGLRRTNERGAYWVTMRAAVGESVQVWSPRDAAYGLPLLIR